MCVSHELNLGVPLQIKNLQITNVGSDVIGAVDLRLFLSPPLFTEANSTT